MLTFPPRPHPHRTQVRPPLPSQPKKKQTLTQLLAEKKQRRQDLVEGCEQAQELWNSFKAWKTPEKKDESDERHTIYYDRTLGFLDQANRVYELLRHCHADR